MKRNINTNLNQVRKFVIVFGIIAFSGLVPTLFLREVTVISSIMKLLFNVFLAGISFWFWIEIITVFLLVLAIIYYIFGTRVWWQSLVLLRDFQKNHGKGSHSLSSIVRV